MGKHSLPAIHCLMTAKSQYLYQAVLENISIKLPHFKPLAAMADWELAARNALKEVYPHIKMYGCWLHFTQRIWMKTQKLRDGDCSPWEFLQTISQTMGKIKTHDIYLPSDSENSEDEDDEIDPSENKYAVCLLPRTTTWVFMPCRHAQCCKECSERLEELRQPCPVCRPSIQSIFQIFN